MEGCLGEESFQMWELNRRLEAYVARVKALEEQNELLGAELGGLRAQTGDASWRARADDELAALRALVDLRWREKHAAEVARDNLAEEVEGVAARCQQQRRARERAAAEAARSRREAEAEKGARARLSSRAAELERELEAVCAAHEQERAALSARPRAPRRPAAPRGPPAPAPELHELARRLGEAWRGAVRGYQERVALMEASLGQARERLGRAVQGAREGRLELRQLRAERGGLRERRAALEHRLEGRWQERLRATEQFQLAVEALEQEKESLQSQIAQVLEGRQQLAHLKMSLSLEVATYRTLLEAENSRLQTPGSGSKASLSFQDPKLELHFSGTPEGRHLGPLLSALSPTPLSLPLPDTLETPVPGFLKSQEFLPARTPTLASTPIPPTLLAPCAVTDAEIKTQDAPLSLLQPQLGRQWAPEAIWAKAKDAIPTSVLPGPEEPGGEQQEASTGQSPEDHTSSAPPLNPDRPSLEATGGEPNGSGMSSRFQEEGEGQIGGLAEKETAIEVKMVNGLQQETWQEDGGLNMKKVQDSQGPLEKETLKSLEEEIQEPLMSLEEQTHETLRSLEKENPESLQSSEEESLDTSKGLEKENQELLMSLEEKNADVVRPQEKETLEPLKPVGNEDSQTLQSLEKENQELMRSLEGTLETFFHPEKESQELVRSREENFESMRDLEKENQEPLRTLEDGNRENLRLQERENQEFLNSPEDEKHKILRTLEKENQELLRSLEEEDQETMKPLEKENQEPVKPLEDENQETMRPLETENQRSLRSLEEEDQETMRPLEKENQEPVKSLEDENQETMRPLETENQRSLRSLEEEGQETMKPLEKENQEPVWSLEDQATLRLLEKENQKPVGSLDKNQETLRPLEIEDQEPVGSLEDENQETLRPLEKENQRSLRSLEEEDQETMKPLEKESQEPVESLEEDQETLRLLEQENQESGRSPGEWGLENSRPPEGRGQESQRCLMEEETPGQMRNQESPGSLKEERQESPLSARHQGREERVADQELGQETPPGGAAGGKEAEAELDVREWGGLPGKSAGHGELQLAAAREVWSAGEGRPGGPEPEEQRVPVEGAGGEGDPEGFQDPEGQPEQAGGPGLRAPQGMSEGRDLVLEGGEEAPRGGQVSEVASTAVGEAALGSQQGPEREVVVPPVGEEGLEAERRQGLEEPQKDPEEAAALKPELSSPAGRSTDPPEPPRGWEESEPEAPWGAEGAFPAETLGRALSGSSAPQPGPQGPEDAGEEAVFEPASPPKPSEPRSPTPIPGDAPGPQPLAAGSQEAGWGLEGRAEALGGVEGEPEELGSEGSPEDLQEEGEENREDSEADELGETLPDSTPLGLYLRSPASPKWDLLGEQRPPPQGETRKEGWDPSVLASEECGAQPGEEEEGEEGRREEECGQDSDLSEEFEDLEAEGSLLPGVPGEAVEPPGQRPQMLLEPAAWEGDGESDGFADEEESGEEGEEDKEEEEGREPGAGLWGPGPSVSTLRALSGPQRGTLPGSETVDVSVPWDDSSRGIAADAGEESQDSTEPEPSGSEEESDPAPLEREDPVPGPLESHCGMGDAGLGVGGSLGVNGRVPSLKEELEHVNGGVVNGLEQSEGGGQGEPGGPLEDEEEGGALKTPWAGPSLHLGPGQFLKFGQREGDVESWSSGED
ncbi:nestin isoform X7 [Leopardus geoffroyi]|uniref:nestin isoform X7 n=1 Tax=Leopardus geoffroyi TaxID=46844 RepID=UPI001E260A04|nr:nestin isoform X7 [Leopardus geoffroyi]